METKILFRKKKPVVHKVIKSWDEKGVDCWLMPFDAFNSLFNGEHVIQLPSGKVCASSVFAGSNILIYRQEKHSKSKLQKTI